MMLRIVPNRLKGKAIVPSGKSMLQRYIILAALADGKSVIENFARSDDVDAAIRCVESLGARTKLRGETFEITGIGGHAVSRMKQVSLPVFNCGESAAVLRFIIPVSLCICGGGTFIGLGRLLSRPLWPYYDVFDRKGIEYHVSGSRLTVSGCLSPGSFSLPGNVSSQFFSGLLMALPLLNGDSFLEAVTPLESAGYVDMTLRALKKAGIKIHREESAFFITASKAKPFMCTAEPDSSAAAMWMAAGLIGNDVEIMPGSFDPISPDAVFQETAVRLRGAGDVELSVAQCPDIAPAVAAVAAVRNGRTVISNAERLRLKESDRMEAIVRTLRLLGADASAESDRLIINGVPQLKGGCEVDVKNDHRIAMMAAVLATVCKDPIVLDDAGCVSKSYPGFFEEYKRLGGVVCAC